MTNEQTTFQLILLDSIGKLRKTYIAFKWIVLVYIKLKWR